MQLSKFFMNVRPADLIASRKVRHLPGLVVSKPGHGEGLLLLCPLPQLRGSGAHSSGPAYMLLLPPRGWNPISPASESETACFSVAL